MKLALIIILIVIANLTLYWLFWGKRKFEEKLNVENNATMLKEENKPNIKN